MSKNKKTYHDKIAEKIVELLKIGKAPWIKTREPGESLPYNPVSGNRYSGINSIILDMDSTEKGYSDARWATQEQISSMGAHVKPEEKGTKIQYWQFREEKDMLDNKGNNILDNNGNPIKEIIELERPRVLFATVFNAAQCHDFPELEKKEIDWSSAERVEKILTKSRARIFHDQDSRSYYSPLFDEIHLPKEERFKSSDHYYSTVLQELVHWTGHESRLNRDIFHNPFGSKSHAREELKAEIASMMLGGDLQLGHNPENHETFIDGWISLMEDDSKEIFRACAEAEKIVNHVLSYEIKIEKEKNQEKNQEKSKDNIKIWLSVPYEERLLAKDLGAKWDNSQKAWFATENSEKFRKWKINPARKIAKERRTLQVPYADRHHAKALGAKWDPKDKVWFAPPNSDLNALKEFLPAMRPPEPVLTKDSKENLTNEAKFRREKKKAYLSSKFQQIANNVDKENLELANPKHPYLQKRQIKPFGIKQKGLHLIIPLQDSSGKVWSNIEIDSKGKQLIPRGSKRDGIFYPLRPLSRSKPVVVARGFEEAASIQACTTNVTVVAVFKGADLVSTAMSISKQYDNKEVFLIGDKSNMQGPIKAIKPIFPRNDDRALGFSDLKKLHGPESVRRQIESNIKAYKRFRRVKDITRTTQITREKQEKTLGR